jgi:hypothetical protein
MVLAEEEVFKDEFRRIKSPPTVIITPGDMIIVELAAEKLVSTISGTTITKVSKQSSD